MKPRHAPLLKRGFNFDYVMWLFTRLSALAMYALALTGLIGALILGARTEMNLADLMRWTFMPNSTHVANTNVPDIAPWASLFWKALAGLFLAFAGAHGLHGVLNVVEDYLSNARLRKFLRMLVLVVLALMTAIGIYVIWTY
jgi:succinate dehydrogenase hydrophobic anchor subunit